VTSPDFPPFFQFHSLEVPARSGFAGRTALFTEARGVTGWSQLFHLHETDPDGEANQARDFMNVEALHEL
jgi:hypothetical protein